MQIIHERISKIFQPRRDWAVGFQLRRDGAVEFQILRDGAVEKTNLFEDIKHNQKIFAK